MTPTATLAPSSVRRFVAISLAVGLLASACGTPSPVLSPSPRHSFAVADPGSPLPVGLAANLDALASYQFSETIPTSSPDAGASSSPGVSTGASASARPSVVASPSSSPSPALSSSASAQPSLSPQPSPSAGPSVTPEVTPVAGSAPLVISGTVINRPVKALDLHASTDEFIVVGSQAWRSADGMTWTVGDPTDTILTDLLPGHDYASWFDSKAGYFHAVGTESRNNVPCIHFKGDASLIGLYTSSGDASGVFEADLWIAQDGDYPVSGVYGFTSPTDSGSWSWGFSFDILNANASANQVTAPVNVVPLPS